MLEQKSACPLPKGIGQTLFYLKLQLLHTDVVAREEQKLVFAEQAAGDAVFVARLQLLPRNVGIDHGLLAVIQACVQKMVDGCQHKGGDLLGSEVINDQKLTGQWSCALFHCLFLNYKPGVLWR